MCLCSGTMYKHKHKQPNIYTITWNNCCHIFFFYSRCLFLSLLLLSFGDSCFLLQINKQAEQTSNAATIQYTNYYCWFISPCVASNFPLSTCTTSSYFILYIHYIQSKIMYFGVYLLFVVNFLLCLCFFSSHFYLFL